MLREDAMMEYLKIAQVNIVNKFKLDFDVKKVCISVNCKKDNWKVSVKSRVIVSEFVVTLFLPIAFFSFCQELFQY